MSVRVWEHFKDGSRRKRVLKHDHVCSRKCLVIVRAFGLKFSYCKRFSYRG